MDNKTSENLAKNEQFLSNLLQKYSIQFTPDIKSKLYTYYEYLIEYNNKVNLTALTEINDVYIKHFADSILGAKFINQNATVCDIGTGAGFPGVVLKIVRPDIKLTLVDSLNKRVDFLKSLLAKLKIDDVQVLHYRAEDTEFKNKHLNTFDYVVARAVARLNTLCEYCLPYVKLNGQFVAYKSSESSDEIAEAQNAIKILGGELLMVENLRLNYNTERTFVLIKKINTTSDKYPRGQNKPRNKPL